MTLNQSERVQLAVDASVEDVIWNVAELCGAYDGDRCYPEEGVAMIKKGVEAIYMAQV